MRFSIVTLGCKVNSYESQYYVEQLTNAGFTQVKDGQDTDICIINTCAVTNTAASKSRQKINQAKRNHPNAYIAVVGCLGQFMDEEKRKELDVDLLMGAKHKDQLVSYIQDMIKNNTKVDTIDTVDQTFDFESMPIHFFQDQHRAFLKVQDGCNQFCSYCAIPYARGRERSLPMEQVVNIAKELEAQGHKEIVLTGIHTGRYNDGANNLTDLLQQLLEQTSADIYYRISSIEITEVTDSLIELMKDNTRICRHLHIPIQSGCDETLKRMNRPYTILDFKNKLEIIRQQIPDISISTDVIAGFIQESDQEFQRTIQTIKDCAFSFLHVFPYSKRDGTVASKMKGELNGSIKKDRVNQLLKLSSLLRQEDMKRFNTIDVLIEQKKEQGYTGYTSQYHPVIIQSEKDISGRYQYEISEIIDNTYIVKGKGKEICA